MWSVFGPKGGKQEPGGGGDPESRETFRETFRFSGILFYPLWKMEVQYVI